MVPTALVSLVRLGGALKSAEQPAMRRQTRRRAMEAGEDIIRMLMLLKYSVSANFGHSIQNQSLQAV
jgi:hypothetical protein